MTKYPAEIDSSIELPTIIDTVTAVNGAAVNRLRDAIISIESELGVNPATVYGTVRARLDSIDDALDALNTAISILDAKYAAEIARLEAQIANLDGGISVGGDLGGDALNQIVIGIQGISVSSTDPSIGQALVYDGTEWVPQKIASDAVQDGGNYGAFYDVVGFSINPSSNVTTFINAAIIEFDPSIITEENGTRTIKLRVIAETTGPQISIRLYNLTTNTIVTGTTLTTTSVTPVLLTTSDISSNLGASSNIYAVQIKAATTSDSSRILLDYASFRIEWS